MPEPATPISSATSIHDRREQLAFSPAPASNRDYITTLRGQLDGAAFDLKTIHLEVRFVPDRYVVSANHFNAYLAHLNTWPFDTLESLCAALRDDFANVLIGKWTQVTVIGESINKHGCQEQQVVMEDRQPKWNNTTLLDRLKPY